jgi:hypothetical protein
VNDTEKSIIQNIAKGYGDIDAASPSLKTLLNLNIDLMGRTIKEENSSVSFDIALGAALLVWTLNQDWPPQDVSSRQMIKSWARWCLDSSMETGTIFSSTLFMAQIAPLVPCIPENTRASFLAELLEELYRQPAPWKTLPHFGGSARYLQLAHDLSLFCGDSLSSTKQTMSSLWCVKAAHHLNEAPAPSNQDLANWLAKSALPLKDRQEVLSWCNPNIWVMPCVSNLLLDTLPASEIERFNKIPWAIFVDNVTSVNRELVRTYCPVSAGIMELIAEEDDWKCRDTISGWLVRVNSSEPEMFALPPDEEPASSFA